MSLHNLAQHVQAAGRGEDKQLVHMTPKEVAGLQALAKAHGGSLTVNPHTGLPEAGFLSSILPMVAGAALTIGSGGALSPLMASLMVGGVGAAATGSLKQGLMMGLGAYGGAGLGAGLAEMGTAATANTVAPSAANEALKAAVPTASGGTAGVFANPTMGGAAAAGNTATAGLTGYTAPAPIANFANPSMGYTPTVPTLQPVNAMGSYVAPVPAVTPGPAIPSAGTPDAVLHPTAAKVNTTVGTAGIKSAGEVAGETAAQRAAENMPVQSPWDKMKAGATKVSNNGIDGLKDLYTAADKAAAYSPMAGLGSLAMGMRPDPLKPKNDAGMIRPYEYTRTQNPEAYDQGAPIWSDNPGSSRERTYFTESMTALEPYKAPGPEYKAAGGTVGEMSEQNRQFLEANDPDMPRMADGGKTTGRYEYSYDPKTMTFTQLAAPKPVAPTSGLMGGLMNGMGSPVNNQYVYAALAGPGMSNYVKPPEPQAASKTPIVTGGIMAPAAQAAPQAQQPAQLPYDIPAYQTPEQQLGLGGFYEYMNQQLGRAGGYAAGGGVEGEYHLGDYSDGGRLLKGPGDGVSDSIPAVIAGKQPARLADGEFVVPARIVSELGNGSTEAGARKLYAMMDRVQKARKKTVGKDAVAVNSKADKHLPA